MTIVAATLVTKDVEPGWPLMADDVPLGKRYLVDVDQIEPLLMVNTEIGRQKMVDCVWVVDPPGGGFLPLFAFKLEGN